jgi:hypothetical protein
LASEQKFGTKVVTGDLLLEIEGNHRSATGNGDIVIGILEVMNVAVSPYEQAHGLVELKTDEYPLKPAQNVLELASLSLASRLGKGVALMATDCNSKWELCYFSDSKTITRRNYSSGRKCCEAFRSLIASAEDRVQQGPPLSRLKTRNEEYEEVDEQSLEGYEEDLGAKDSKAAALDAHTMLNAFASQLADLYGERPHVLEWAQAGGPEEEQITYKLL